MQAVQRSKFIVKLDLSSSEIKPQGYQVVFGALIKNESVMDL
jgi:hypothetical protein